MAERRMLSKRITDTDEFIEMSASAQALYLHLVMSADDDGFSNQVSISMFKAHASVQDIETLQTKQYIYRFESGVIVIAQWRVSNAIRKDRYIPTIYENERSQLGVLDNGTYYRLPDGCQMVANLATQISVGKDSIEESSGYTTTFEYLSEEKLTIIKNEWNRQITTQSIRKLIISEDRAKKTMQCLTNCSFEEFLAVINSLDSQYYFKCTAEKGNKVSYDWFVKQENFIKVLEGNYKNPFSTTKKTASSRGDERQYTDEDFQNIEQAMTNQEISYGSL